MDQDLTTLLNRNRDQGKRRNIIIVGVLQGLNYDVNMGKTDTFLYKWHNVLEEINRIHETMIIGDLNCRERKAKCYKVVGRYGEETRHDNGNIYDYNNTLLLSITIIDGELYVSILKYLVKRR